MNEDQDGQKENNTRIEEEEKSKQQQQFLYMGRCKSCNDPLILYVNNDEYEEAVLKCGCKEKLIMIEPEKLPSLRA